MNESFSQRSRRKFTAGALEQAAQILGATAASVLVAGLVGPYIAAFAGMTHSSGRQFVEVAILALTIAFGAAVGAIVLRGLARAANDDGRIEMRSPFGEDDA